MERRPATQALIGTAIMVIGAIALLNQLDVVDVSIGRLLATWWPAVIIVLGVAGLAAAPRAWPAPLAVAAAGGVLLAGNLGVVDGGVWPLIWPVAIILVGLSFLTRAASSRTDERYVTATAIWWGAQRRPLTQDFRGAQLSVLMGGVDLDLRNAQIVERAEIRAFAMWGGIDVKVPHSWRVEIVGLPLLGGWENRTTVPSDPEAPVLVVRVITLMGGVDVKSKAPANA
ncbi:LiaF transmembrane domain-containing protein [Cellulomonas sp. P22]|uniref:LiaF transmembrane domain-containing protein n=1 Tax=Cellulomonas sp. P22 TaxID=3373189 RepID=UPI00378AA84A